MAELEVFNSILRTRDGGIYGLNVTQNFYFMRSPKLFVTITNPPAKDSTTGKGRYAKVFLDMTEVIGLIRKLKAGVAHNRSDQGKMELCKIYKGGRDNKRRFGVDIVSRIFTVYAEKGRIFMKIELSKGTQAMTKNKFGQSVPGVVRPAGGPALETVSFALNEDTALNFAFMLDKEYAAWRAALNLDFLYHQDKYAYHGENRKPQEAEPPAGAEEAAF